MPEFVHDDLSFHYRTEGEGTTVVFQHGLGGDVNQPCGLFTPPVGFRLLALDCRGHGQTRPLGDSSRLTIADYADDLLALLDCLDIDKVIVGGISMGAAVTLNFTLRYPERVLGLIQSRVAWLEGPNRDNAKLFSLIARLIREEGLQQGRQLFQDSDDYHRVLRESMDTAASLLAQFDHPRAEETVMKLERIPLDSPYRSEEELHSIRVPTLVLANRQDPVHPYQFGETVARAISAAEFRELTPKSTSVERHGADVQRYITEFLGKHFG